ncbi:SusC/RagA family TonB-linked outer membrane protein [Echinicola pacifica]|uniref:SusC/RagA family TonB-linked outer membrane protein n=1 Tax=Echinicola pacifica TaxID=346377 RepID=A0A918PLM2_9BACT|nr:TonB-dependent receptor [Echinicola pacifica]GGZ13894.1 SusC/RagA family TonB-linked outer membrane protein [Echinicola pacifica]
MKVKFLPILGCLLIGNLGTAVASPQALLSYNDQVNAAPSTTGRSVTLSSLLQQVEGEFGVSFLYKDKIGTAAVLTDDSQMEGRSLGEVLKGIHSTNPQVVFKRIKDNFYTVKVEESPAAMSSPTLMRSTSSRAIATVKAAREVSGEVRTADGETLPGVSLMIKGTTKGTVTDLDGRFSLSVPEGPVTLVVSFVGYKKKEIALSADQRQVAIVMDNDVQSLDEVVVVAYGEQTRASFTGSAVDVNMDKVQGAPRASFQESLQGNIAGVQSAAPSGQPGYAPNIRIRGVGSINASSDPLYVIDGIPVVAGNISQIATSSNTIAGLNPNDIASMTVLKDASATSIYGSRGANGVILITTKQGKSGKTKFDVSMQRGTSQVLLDDRNRPLTTPELAELLVESRVNTGESQQLAEEYIYSRIDENINTNWFDVITRDGTYQQYYISASGGNEKTNFYSSIGYYDQQAPVIGIDYEKLNGKVNVRHSATDKLTLDLGLAANTQLLHTNSEAGSANNPIRSMFREVPWEPVYNEDGSYNTDILLTYNPVGLVNENIRETKLYNALGNVGVKYDILNDFSFETKASLDFNLADEFQYDNPYFGEGRNDGGRGRAYTNMVVNWNVTNLLKYRWIMDDKNTINFTLGQEAQKISANSVFAYASNYGAPGLTTLANASVKRDASSEKTASSITSYFLSANYSYTDRYYLNVTGRRDGSSRFGSSVRYANFGSVGLGWNIHKEAFMESSWVDELKLRASYGINGNQGIGDFESRGLYNTGNDYNGSPGYAYSQQSNPFLTWEKNKPMNIGLDFRIVKSISGTIEYYNRVTSDLLLNVPISGTNGITSYMANIGEMQNRGWELSLSSVNIDQPEGLFWSTDLNLTTNKNEILQLNNDEQIIEGQYIRREGGDYYSFYMPGYAGVDAANGDALWFTDASETETTNDYKLADPYEQGSALPKFFAGLTNNFAYKNFNLSFLFYLNYGNKVYDYWGRYLASDGSAELNDRGNMSRKIYDRRWQEPGDVTDVPKMVWGNTQSGSSAQHSTRFLYDGTYIRLRDITLSYNLPSAVLSKLKISNAKIYLRGNNVWTWVKDKNLESDPEVGIAGMTDLRIPTSRQYLLGIDFSF